MEMGRLDLNRRVMIVAEIGNNHEGDVALAEQLIGLAAEAGADAVKFQTYRTERLVRPDDAHRFAQLRSFELSEPAVARLSEVAAQAGLLFLSTPLDLPSVAVLEPLVAAFKIASGDNTFIPLLEAVAATGKPVIISTGLAALYEIAAARRALERVWRPMGLDARPVLLHAVSCYPTPMQEANLSAIGTLARTFRCPVGYSDHTVGIEAAVCAVAAGARVVEKHFTISREHSDFRDHALSADPAQLRDLVRRIRDLETMMGDGDLAPRACEQPSIPALRRTAVATRDLRPGDVVTPDDVIWLRGGSGIRARHARRLFGAKIVAPVAKDGSIESCHVAVDDAPPPREARCA